MEHEGLCCHDFSHHVRHGLPRQAADRSGEAARGRYGETDELTIPADNSSETVPTAELAQWLASANEQARLEAERRANPRRRR